MIYIPREIVNLIADYHDYEKYCKPIHAKNIQPVLKDIIDMGTILRPIWPSIAYQCWNDRGWKQYEENRTRTRRVVSYGRSLR